MKKESIIFIIVVLLGIFVTLYFTNNNTSNTNNKNNNGSTTKDNKPSDDACLVDYKCLTIDNKEYYFSIKTEVLVSNVYDYDTDEYIYVAKDSNINIENIIRNNIGKKVRVHASFSDSVEWRDRVFTGIIEHAGRDNLVLNDVENNKHYLILMIYVDFFEFDEEIIYAK